LDERREDDMRVGFSDPRLVDPFYAVGCEDSDGDVLRYDRLSVSSHTSIQTLFSKRIVAEWVWGRRFVQEAVSAVAAADSVGDDCEGEDWHAIFLCEADGGGGGVYGGFEGTVEGWEG
tara:strand:+ start:255 stop:608 length:354 start_codon:yes stop_codon:yes gene_type:complete